MTPRPPILSGRRAAGRTNRPALGPIAGQQPGSGILRRLAARGALAADSTLRPAGCPRGQRPAWFKPSRCWPLPRGGCRAGGRLAGLAGLALPSELIHDVFSGPLARTAKGKSKLGPGNPGQPLRPTRPHTPLRSACSRPLTPFATTQRGSDPNWTSWGRRLAPAQLGWRCAASAPRWRVPLVSRGEITGLYLSLDTAADGSRGMAGAKGARRKATQSDAPSGARCAEPGRPKPRASVKH